MKILRIVFIFFIQLFHSYLFGQENSIIDSLKLKSRKLNNIELIKVYNEISWYYKNSNLDSAWYYAKKAEQESYRLNNKQAIASAYNSLGSVFESKSNLDSALYYHKKSLSIKKSIQDSVGIADSYNNIGIIHDIQGNYLEALNNYFKSLNIYKKNTPSIPFDKIPAVLTNIGIVYKKQKQFNKVLDYYENALAIYEANNFKIGIAITTANIGSTLIKLRKYEKSIKYSQKANKLYSDLELTRYIPYTLTNIAIAYDSIKRHKDAQKLYNKAIKQFSRDNNFYELANTKISLANNYILTNNMSEANKELKDAVKVATKKNFDEMRMKAFKLLSKKNSTEKDYKNAYFFFTKYSSLKDSLFETEKTKLVFELDTKYQTAEKEQKIAKQEQELLKHEITIKNRNLLSLIIGATLLLIGLLIFGFYKKNIYKRKQLEREMELKETLATIQTQNKLQEQRLRISRDLHDNIGSQLTFVISSLDNLQYASKNLNETLKTRISGVAAFTTDTIDQLRDTIWAMNKDEITLEDLQTRILSFIEKAKIAKPNINFVVKSNLEKEADFTSIEGINIFRVIQEAINNALKYSEADTIKIEASEVNDKIVISISDNGIGFNPKTVELGNGLSNMEKRMSEIGGKIFILSKLNQGTTIKIEVNTKNTTNGV